MSAVCAHILSVIAAADTGAVWVPTDFAHLGPRSVIDKTLQRLVTDGTLRRIDRGLYDLPGLNQLTRRPTVPDCRAVLEAIARRDQLRLLVDGMTAANDLGLTDAVPGRVTIYTDARRRDVRLENLRIEFKRTAPSRLYWAGRRGMRVVQALHWLKDTMPVNGNRVSARLNAVLTDAKHGPAIANDLVEGFAQMPAWMQDYLRTVPALAAILASTSPLSALEMSTNDV